MIKNYIIILIFTIIIGLFLIIKGILGILKKKINLNIYPNKTIKIKGKLSLAYSIIDILLGALFSISGIIVIILSCFGIIELK